MEFKTNRIKKETLDDIMSDVCNILKEKGYTVSVSRLEKEFPDRLSVLPYDESTLEIDENGDSFYYMGLHNSVDVKCIILPEDSFEYIGHMKRYSDIVLRETDALVKIISPFSRISIDFLEKLTFSSFPKGFDAFNEKDKFGNELYSISTTVYYEFDSLKNDIYEKLNMSLIELKKWAEDLPIRDGYVVSEKVVSIDFDKLKFKKMLYQKAYDLYGEKLPVEITKRIEEELSALLYSDDCNDGDDSYKLFEYVLKFINECRKNNIFFSYRGYLGSSFVSYLLGLHDVNPLSAHYKCDKCNQVRFVETETFGRCLKSKSCSCGGTMIGDGYDLPSYSFYGLGNEQLPKFDYNFGSKNSTEVIEIYKKIFNCEYQLVLDNKGIFKTVVHVGSSKIDFNIMFVDFINELNSVDQMNLKLGKIDFNELEIYEYLNSNSDDVVSFFRDVVQVDYNLFRKLRVENFSDLVYACGILNSVSKHSKIVGLINEVSNEIKSIIYSRESLTNYLISLDGNFDTSDCYLSIELLKEVQFVDRYKDEVDSWFVDFINNTEYMFPKAHVVSYALMHYLIIYNRKIKRV